MIDAIGLMSYYGCWAAAIVGAFGSVHAIASHMRGCLGEDLLKDCD